MLNELKIVLFKPFFFPFVLYFNTFFWNMHNNVNVMLFIWMPFFLLVQYGFDRKANSDWF